MTTTQIKAKRITIGMLLAMCATTIMLLFIFSCSNPKDASSTTNTQMEIETNLPTVEVVATRITNCDV